MLHRVPRVGRGGRGGGGGGGLAGYLLRPDHVALARGHRLQRRGRADGAAGLLRRSILRLLLHFPNVMLWFRLHSIKFERFMSLSTG